MLDRFERPLKILCIGLGLLLVWQLGSLLLKGDPLAHLKIPPLPTLPGSTNEPARQKTNALALNKSGTNGTNAASGTHAIGTNAAIRTNATAETNANVRTNAKTGTNASTATNVVTTTNSANSTNTANATNDIKGTNAMAALTPEMIAKMPPEVLARMRAGGMPGGPGGAAMKKLGLPPEVQGRVDRIIESEIFGPVIRVSMALLGIADQEAYLRATNGQVGPVKVGGEMGGIKLLRIGVNRVLVETDGEKKELTLFGGVGGASLMPKSTNAPSTNAPSTNAPTTNTPAKKASTRDAAGRNASTNNTLSPKQ